MRRLSLLALAMGLIQSVLPIVQQTSPQPIIGTTMKVASAFVPRAGGGCFCD